MLLLVLLLIDQHVNGHVIDLVVHHHHQQVGNAICMFCFVMNFVMFYKHRNCIITFCTMRPFHNPDFCRMILTGL